MTTISPDLMTPKSVQWAVEQACRAPSIHNTQPWRFRWDGRHFELHADTARGLSGSDPDGRELVISCGAALFNLRVALRKLGCAAQVTLLPEPDQPRVLARVDVADSSPASVEERLAYAALTRRHTRRSGFEDRPLAPGLAVGLQRAAQEEQAELVYVSDPGQRRRVLDLARAAERRLRSDEQVRDELLRWAPAPAGARRDGVPATAYAAEPVAAPDDLPARDFDQGRGVGRLDTDTDAAQPGTVAVLTTAHDLQRDWLQAGQALERVLVTAAERWAFAALHSQVVEVPESRAELRRELCTSGYPQLLLRFGYASASLATPRRPVTDVLELN